MPSGRVTGNSSSGDESAGVDNDNLAIYLVGIVAERIPILFEQLHQLLGIYQILRATERDNVYSVFEHIILRSSGVRESEVLGFAGCKHYLNS